MNKKLITKGSNALSITKATNRIALTNKLLKQAKSHELLDTSWADRLWEWADNNHICEKELPRTYNELISLSVLSLWHKNISELPKEIGQLLKLTKLNLGSNESPRVHRRVFILSHAAFADSAVDA